MTRHHTLFVFPGQGSQHIGMASGFMDHEFTKEIFEEADDVLGFSLSKMMREGSEDELGLTINTQPALLLAGMAVAKYIYKSTDRINLHPYAAAVAGHSLGEYTALCAAGSLSLKVGLELVRKRGEAMQGAVPAGKGAMAAIIGMEYANLESIIRKTGCYIANDNSPSQVVISGDEQAVDEASNMLAVEGAKKIVRLNVSAPFHCPLMQPAADIMQIALQKAQFAPVDMPVYQNITGEKTSSTLALEKGLVEQVTGRVRWRETMVNAAASGITEVVECGAGKVLTGLAKRVDGIINTATLNTPEDVDAWLEARHAE
ncbi:MAG: ACP S-malonyltransferase [Alphaproteobacteria bacterium]|nr:ACP S-malonyltransferase [Alphaproteobacteria bacterium]